MNLLICASLFLLINVSACSGEIKELKTLEDVRKFIQQDKAVAILYFKHVIPTTKPIKSRTLTVMEHVQKEIESSGTPYMQLAKVNCLTDAIQGGNLKECQKKRSFYAYKMKGEMEQRYQLQELFSVQSFEAQLLSFVYNDKIGYVQDENDLEDEMAGGTKNVFLIFTQGIGSEDHYKFMKFATKNLDNYRFTVSTDAGLLKDTFGGQAVDEFGLWYLACKDRTQKGMCPYHRYPGQHFPQKDLVIDSFITNIGKPVIEDINDDGTTSQPEGVHLLYLLADNDEDITKLSQMTHNAIQSVNTDEALLHAIIVDTRKFKNLTMFGHIRQDLLPLVIMELNDRRNAEMRFFEYFPPDQELGEKEFVKFVDDVINNLDEFSKTIADIYNVKSMASTEWEHPTEDTSKLVAHCGEASKFQHICDDFQFQYRLLVRTMQVHGLIDLDYVYVDYTDEYENSTNTKLPKVVFYLEGKGKHEIEYKKEQNMYLKMLEWVNKLYEANLSSNLKAIPASTCDTQGLSLNSLTDVNKHSLSDDMADLQDDEISKDATSSSFYRDSVEILTDKTFNKALTGNDFLVVMFTVEFDSRSKLFEPVFAKIHDSLAKEDVNSVTAKLGKVNCYEEFNTCKQLQIINYPIIKVFKHGKFVATYMGLMDEESIKQAIHLYQQPPFIALTRDTVGSFETESKSSSTVDYLGWFPEENEDFATYKRVAEENYGKYTFAYVIDEDISQIPSGYTFPFIAAYIRNDDLRKSQIMLKSYTEANFRTFIIESAIPLLGELTMGIFPAYKSMGLPFILLFIDGKQRENSPAWTILVNAAKEEKERNVLFAWMNTEHMISRKIRQKYLGTKSPKQSIDLVLVNHTRGDVYVFDKSGDVTINGWINNCKDGKTNRISALTNKTWKPLREGFDFLYFIDHGIGGAHGKTLNEVDERSHGGRLRPHVKHNDYVEKGENIVATFDSAGSVNINALGGQDGDEDGEIDQIVGHDEF